MIAGTRNALAAAFALTLLTSACASSGNETPGFAPDLAAAHDRYVQHMQRRDMTQVEDYIAPDAELRYRVSSILGRARVLAYFTSSGTQYGSAAMRPVKVTNKSQTEVVERGRWFGQGRNGTYTHLWVLNQAGEWRLKSIDIYDDVQSAF
jgi:hypothetical protein